MINLMIRAGLPPGGLEAAAAPAALGARRLPRHLAGLGPRRAGM